MATDHSGTEEIGHLCLTRRFGQQVIIRIPGHSPIVITVKYPQHGQVKLEFEAPLEMVIKRKEIA
jgi:sRNA-binding carbon storage regulator CsrA